jgi:hypothetical protein
VKQTYMSVRRHLKDVTEHMYVVHAGKGNLPAIRDFKLQYASILARSNIASHEHVELVKIHTESLILESRL